MADKIFTAFFTKNGAPETGLTPTIDVWELDAPPATSSTQTVTGAAVQEVGGGFYRYNFASYDYASNYNIKFDGGVTLADAERYKFAANDSFQEDIAFQNWEETAADHIGTGTTGLQQSTIAANVVSIRTTDLPAIMSLLTLTRKYQTNRTKIDKTAKTLTVYDDDCTTVLRVFHLLDSTGTPSTTEVCERDPDATLNDAANAGSGSTDPSASCP